MDYGITSLLLFFVGKGGIIMGAFGFLWFCKDIETLEAMLAKTKNEEEAEKIRKRIEELKHETRC